jgi:hypothetical protein
MDGWQRRCCPCRDDAAPDGLLQASLQAFECSAEHPSASTPSSLAMASIGVVKMSAHDRIGFIDKIAVERRACHRVKCTAILMLRDDQRL